MAKKKQAVQPMPTDQTVPRPGHVLVLRVCHADLSSRDGFVWPESGPVTCPDWDPAPVCGSGLHGWKWGEGNANAHGSADPWSPESKWLVVEVAESDLVEIDSGEKVKFRAGTVVHCGDQKSATEYIVAHGGHGRAVIGGIISAGYRGTATAGYRGTATAGYRGTATAGYRGTATAGYRGTATAGEGGTATAGDRGTATAGEGGTISIRYWDPKRSRYRIVSADVGEDGIEPNTAYVVDETTRKLVQKVTDKTSEEAAA